MCEGICLAGRRAWSGRLRGSWAVEVVGTRAESGGDMLDTDEWRRRMES